MKKQVEIVEVLNRIVEVEAIDDDDAIAKVEKMYFNEEIILDSNDMTAPVEFNIID